MTAINILLGTAVFLGFIHTILGPDHYIPFVVLSKARQWNLRQTLFTTMYCGLGHLVSSIIIGLIGIALGFGISYIDGVELMSEDISTVESIREGVAIVESMHENIETAEPEHSGLFKFESARGNLAGWAFLLFGLAYMVWGIVKAFKNKPHTHIHSKSTQMLTPWVLFVIFVLGPCEILIPLVMIPAANHSVSGIISVALMFSTVTILTMCAAVKIGYYGFKALPSGKIDRYMHAIAGAAICFSGGAILFLGL